VRTSASRDQIARNQARERRVEDKLRNMGWSVCRADARLPRRDVAGLSDRILDEQWPGHGVNIEILTLFWGDEFSWHHPEVGHHRLIRSASAGSNSSRAGLARSEVRGVGLVLRPLKPTMSKK
jgi:hypothetical protein